jgi:hypothetical protein
MLYGCFRPKADMVYKSFKIISQGYRFFEDS